MKNMAEKKIHEVDEVEQEDEDDGEYESVQHVSIRCADVEVTINGVSDLDDVVSMAAQLFNNVWERTHPRQPPSDE